MRKITKTALVANIGLIIFIVHQFSTNNVARNLSSEELNGVIDKVKSYSSPGSIVAIINAPKMGTGGLHSTFVSSWRCPNAPHEQYMAAQQCEDGRRIARTHHFAPGYADIKKHREEYPEGQCLIVSAVRSPATWFASIYLQRVKRSWRSTEEMLKNYRKFLATLDFTALQLYGAIPNLLENFNAGTLTQQMKIMDDNGGYSFIAAPKESTLEGLAGCDFLFLQMEQSDRWPDILKMLDPVFVLRIGNSRLHDHPDNAEQINAIAAYKLTSEEKVNIYNTENKFIQEWFDAYRYMDDVIDSAQVLTKAIE